MLNIFEEKWLYKENNYNRLNYWDNMKKSKKNKNKYKIVQNIIIKLWKN